MRFREGLLITDGDFRRFINKRYMLNDVGSVLDLI